MAKGKLPWSKKTKLEPGVVYLKHYPSKGRAIPTERADDWDPKTQIFCERYKSGLVTEQLPKAEKVLVVGDSACGKTGLIQRYCKQSHTEKYTATVGGDFNFQPYSIFGVKFELHFWEVGGKKEVKQVSQQMYGGASAVILCFSLGEERSLHHVAEWLNDVKKENAADPAVFLVGNKSDSFHMVTDESAETVALDIKAEYFETSGRTDSGVSEVFERLAAVIFERSVREFLKVHTTENEVIEAMLAQGDHVNQTPGHGASVVDRFELQTPVLIR
ncbi:ras-related protein Rab-34 [Planoprotostelium fungivorum]|uniref:Ras-related protein Rab-34 n=1 Tax=Planoprotostelium fungivorum TaxID=1890364 RepID=A0A2P6NT00_9EUKA|nr:ras-related protein Rab-34 [Planoprotostelium fungivorum]